MTTTILTLSVHRGDGCLVLAAPGLPWLARCAHCDAVLLHPAEPLPSGAFVALLVGWARRHLDCPPAPGAAERERFHRAGGA